MADQVNPIRYVDLFAGCGGLSDGFQAHGNYSGVAHVEWEAKPAIALANRLATKWAQEDAARRVIKGDIQELPALFSGHASKGFSAHAGLDTLVSESGGIDAIIGGPPCQAYSVAGRVRDEHGMEFDYRNYLFESYLAVVQRYRPTAFVFENVPGMLSAAPGGVSISERIAKCFRKAGYQIREDLRACVVNAADYGVPQQRKRVILVGLRRDIKDAEVMLGCFYETLANSRCRKWTTVWDAIGHLPKLMPLRKPARKGGRLFSHSWDEDGIIDHCPRFHSTRDQAIFKMLARDIERATPRFASPESLKALYTERTGRISAVHKYHVLRRNEPSNLIPAHLYKDGLRHIHFDPQQARSITVREAALLQGFDSDFEFAGSQGDRYKMIGNAVPPPLARALAEALASTVFGVSARSRPRRRTASSVRRPSSSGVSRPSGLRRNSGCAAPL